MNIAEALPRNAQRFPKKPALVDGKRRLTYKDLHLRTNRLGNYLLKQGIRPGDPVALSCGSRAEHFEILFALAKIGAIAFPFDYHWSAREGEAMIEFSEPRAFIVEGRDETRELWQRVCECSGPGNSLGIEMSTGAGTSYEEALSSSPADDPGIQVSGKNIFLVMITSGTTGFPRGCAVNHETYLRRCINNIAGKELSQNERALSMLPLHFNAGRGSMMRMLYLGATVFLQEKFDEKVFLEIVEGEKITYTMLVPALCNRLLQCEKLDQFQTSSLDYVGITGGHLSRDVAQGMIERVCPRLYEAYASTDCGPMTVLAPEDRASHGDSVGRPIPCVMLKITDEGDEEVPSGSEGEIFVHTPLAIQGYYRNPQATDEFLRGGWCRTGDVGFVDPAGYLHISGRRKLMIKSGGISIFPEEIEETLLRHPAVAEAAVVGVKSPQWEEAVKALVVLKKGASLDRESLIRFCKESLASYKAPKFVEFMPSLPRTGLGKINRGKLEEMNRA
ncbi:MAG: acyl--CoA ligase [Deltaproteobacteria bacterium]|nr:acyl--CoA ligase [Deltaproteobacteria bacterium]